MQLYWQAVHRESGSGPAVSTERAGEHADLTLADNLGESLGAVNCAGAGLVVGPDGAQR